MVAAIFLSILFLGFVGGLGYLRWREDRYLKKKPKDAMSKGLKEEIERERKDAERRKKTFEDQMKKFNL